MNLQEFIDKRKHGYARDIALAILEGNGEGQDADTLFRTLVLDESIDVETAKDLYNEASNLIDNEESEESEDDDSEL
jgi:hypothetical protein